MTVSPHTPAMTFTPEPSLRVVIPDVTFACVAVLLLGPGERHYEFRGLDGCHDEERCFPGHFLTDGAAVEGYEVAKLRVGEVIPIDRGYGIIEQPFSITALDVGAEGPVGRIGDLILTQGFRKFICHGFLDVETALQGAQFADPIGNTIHRHVRGIGHEMQDLSLIRAKIVVSTCCADAAVRSSSSCSVIRTFFMGSGKRSLNARIGRPK